MGVHRVFTEVSCEWPCGPWLCTVRSWMGELIEFLVFLRVNFKLNNQNASLRRPSEGTLN